METLATVVNGSGLDIGYIVKTALLIIFAFGLVIFIHELGHFCAAKLVGVMATDFAMGMGPEIFGVTRGETRYKLCAFPIGGYVKLLGEEDDDIPSHLQNRSLRAKPTWAKCFVIFAGPFMNFILAIVLGALVFLIWGEQRPLPALEEKDIAPVVILNLVDPRKPAGKAGIRTYDTLVSINGQNATSTFSVKKMVADSGGKELVFGIKRNYKNLKFKVTPKKVSYKDKKSGKMISDWQIGIMMSPPMPRIVNAVKPGSPAARAGLVKGDLVLDIDGQHFETAGPFKAGEPVTDLLVYRKKGAPEKMSFSTPAGAATGIDFASINMRVGPVDAIARGTKECVRIIAGTVVGIQKMITREIPADDIAGPVGIIQYASSFARTGMRDFIWFFSMISVSLGFINLVPFPALDGSLIVMFIWEGIIRRPLDPKKQGIVIYVGFSILMGLIVLVTFRDLRIWLGF